MLSITLLVVEAAIQVEPLLLFRAIASAACFLDFLSRFFFFQAVMSLTRAWRGFSAMSQNTPEADCARFLPKCMAVRVDRPGKVGDCPKWSFREAAKSVARPPRPAREATSNSKN